VNAESRTPGRSLPSKEELLDYQGRWLRKAGYAGLAGALIVAAGIVLQRVGLHLPSGNSDADQLVFEHAHSSRLIYSSVIQGIGFCLFAIPLTFLFRSAAGRAARMRKAFLPVILIGPVAFGIGLAISSVGSTIAASDFVDQEPAKVQQAREQAVKAQAATPAPKAKEGTTSTTKAREKTTSTASTATGTESTTTPTTAPAATPKTPDQAAHDAREGLADHLNRHTTVLIVGGILSTLGVLALVFGMIYTNLWCMRLGLLTRFWGALGMAFGLFLIIPLFPPIPGLVLWFAVTGLMLAGFWPRPLPPSWAAGEAIPWQSRSGDLGPPPAERGEGGTVEGSGREVSDPPLPEEGGENGEPPQPPYGETQGQRRKKRKRRS
jgi:hypothetical protein